MAEGYDPKPDYDIDYDENEDYPSEGQTKDEKIELIGNKLQMGL